MTEGLNLFIAFSIGFLLVYISIPVLVKISIIKNLMERPDERRVHTIPITNIGGIAIFIGFSLSSIVALNDITFKEFPIILGALIIMFFIGLKDDLVMISPIKKLIAQLIAGSLLIVLGHFNLNNLHGICGIYELSNWLSFPFTLLVIAFIINAFNLIDGVDGLASGLGILLFSIFGYLFYQEGVYQYTILCMAMVGSLVSFFQFNVFGKKNKIFLGDTGSLIVGALVSVVVIRYNQLNSPLVLQTDSSPLISIAIIIIPIFDTLRVFTLRIVKKRSPFSPDKNHIHHRLLNLGLTHLQTTITILIANILLIILSISIQPLGLNTAIFVLLVTTCLLFKIPSLLIKVNKITKRDKNSEYQNYRGVKLLKVIFKSLL